MPARYDLVDLERSRVLQAFSGKSAVFSADGQILALLDRDQIKLYDVSSGNFLQTLEGSFQAVSSLQFAPDGRSLAIVGNGPVNSLTAPQALIWQLPDGKRTVVDIQDPLELTYAPNEGTLLVWTAESIHVFDPNTAAKVATFDEYGTNVDGVAFSPDWKTLVANSGNPHLTARFWGLKMASWKMRSKIQTISGMVLQRFPLARMGSSCGRRAASGA
jgi:WD40 repeat protein